jgi:hypothetical protein
MSCATLKSSDDNSAYNIKVNVNDDGCGIAPKLAIISLLGDGVDNTLENIFNTRRYIYMDVYA